MAKILVVQSLVFQATNLQFLLSLQKPVTYEPGRVLYINGLSDNLNLIKLKKLFNEFAPVAWIEYNNGDLQVWSCLFIYLFFGVPLNIIFETVET